MTASWRGDLEHFRWLRRSLDRAGLGEVPHKLVVHTEDLERFQEFRRPSIELLATADILPADLEARRLKAQQCQQRLGARLSKLCVSLNKRFGWVDWVRGAGWQMQQINKLALAAAQPADVVVVLDSDLLITRGFDLSLFAPDGHVAVFEHWTPEQGRWHASTYRLLRQPLTPVMQVNDYVGTPFVFEPHTVQALQQWLEQTYQQPWYEVLLAQPVSSWSEFCIYGLFARAHGDAQRLAYVSHPHGQDLYRDELVAGPAEVERSVRQRFENPEIYFTNIPTQRLAKGRWSIGALEGVLRNILER